MKEDEFSQKNWKGMAAGRRKAFYVQVIPTGGNGEKLKLAYPVTSL